MANGSVGSLFGGLAQGAEVGMRLGQHQQLLDLQSQNAQRLQDIAQRQTALQFYSAFVNTLSLEPNERGPALDKLQETAQGMGVNADPALFEHARKLTADQAKATANLIGQFVPNASTQDLINLPKNYLGTVLPLLIQGRYRQDLQESLGNLGAPQGIPTPQSQGTSPQSAPVPMPQAPPLSELDQLKTTFAMNERKLSLLSQYGTVVPEAKEMATILNDQQNRIQQRLTQLQAGPLMTPERLTGILQRALEQERPDLKPGTPAYQVALDQAYANYSKIVPVQAGGEAFGGLGLVVPRAAAAPAPTAGTPAGPMPLVSRPQKLEEPAVKDIATTTSIINTLRDLAQKGEQYDNAQSMWKLQYGPTGEKLSKVKILTEGERAFLTDVQRAQVNFERGSAGLSVFRSPAAMAAVANIIGNPWSPGLPTRLSAVADQLQKELTDFKTAQQQAGRQVPSLGPTPQVPQTSPNAQAEAEAFLKKFRK